MLSASWPKGSAAGNHDGVRRVVILGRGGAGKSVLSRQLSDITGILVVELDTLFWQPGPAPHGRVSVGGYADILREQTDGAAGFDG